MLSYNETNWLLTLFRSCSVVTASVWATVDRALSLRSPNAIGAFWQWAGGRDEHVGARAVATGEGGVPRGNVTASNEVSQRYRESKHNKRLAWSSRADAVWVSGEGGRAARWR